MINIVNYLHHQTINVILLPYLTWDKSMENKTLSPDIEALMNAMMLGQVTPYRREDGSWETHYIYEGKTYIVRTKETE